MLQVDCGCGARMTVPEALAGQTGRCPTCGRALRVPNPQALSPRVPPTPSSARLVTAPAGETLAYSTRQFVAFRCRGCAGELRVPLREAGKAACCHHCGEAYTTPAPSPSR